MGQADVYSLRDEFESNTEWNLRKQFLERNIEDLPLERLICLSRCFVNMAMYGCSYPMPVMREVKERSGGLLDEIDAEKKQKSKQDYQDGFVAASN